MFIDEIRKSNLKLLVKEMGSIVAVANASETSPAYLSQILNGVLSSTKTPRSIGNKLARKIEEGCNRPKGWMDVEPKERGTAKEPTAEYNAKRDETLQFENMASFNAYTEGLDQEARSQLLEIASNFVSSNKKQRKRMVESSDSYYIASLMENKAEKELEKNTDGISLIEMEKHKDGARRRQK